MRAVSRVVAFGTTAGVSAFAASSCLSLAVARGIGEQKINTQESFELVAKASISGEGSRLSVIVRGRPYGPESIERPYCLSTSRDRLGSREGLAGTHLELSDSDAACPTLGRELPRAGDYVQVAPTCRLVLVERDADLDHLNPVSYRLDAGNPCGIRKVFRVNPEEADWLVPLIAQQERQWRWYCATSDKGLLLWSQTQNSAITRLEDRSDLLKHVKVTTQSPGLQVLPREDRGTLVVALNPHFPRAFEGAAEGVSGVHFVRPGAKVSVNRKVFRPLNILVVGGLGILLLVTIPLDVVTSPLQFVYFAWGGEGCRGLFGGALGHAEPIPVRSRQDGDSMTNARASHDRARPFR